MLTCTFLLSSGVTLPPLCAVSDTKENTSILLHGSETSPLKNLPIVLTLIQSIKIFLFCLSSDSKGQPQEA